MFQATSSVHPATIKLQWCLFRAGMGNYMNTMNCYYLRLEIERNGWKIVGSIFFSFLLFLLEIIHRIDGNVGNVMTRGI